MGFSDRKIGPSSCSGGASHIYFGKNPTWLTVHPHKPILFAAQENNGGWVSSFHVKPNGALQLINQVSTHGSSPCHLDIDPHGKFLAAANYSTGNAPVFRINEDGSLAEPPVSFIQHQGKSVNERRQESPHAHQVVFDTKLPSLFVVDLGIDQVLKYNLDNTGGLSGDPEKVSFAAGAGPRHLAFHPSQPFAFVLHELDSTISTLRYDSLTGTLHLLDSLSTIPGDYKGDSYPAEVAVSQDGRFVYCSNRGPDNIAIFEFKDHQPFLVPVAHVPAEGKHPRHFTFSPDGKFLLVANQNTDNVVVFNVDQATGLLTKSHAHDVATPACISFLTQH